MDVSLRLGSHYTSLKYRQRLWRYKITQCSGQLILATVLES